MRWLTKKKILNLNLISKKHIFLDKKSYTYIVMEMQPMMMALFCYRLDQNEALIMTTLEWFFFSNNCST